jgi:hypothetical protein
MSSYLCTPLFFTVRAKTRPYGGLIFALRSRSSATEPRYTVPRLLMYTVVCASCAGDFSIVSVGDDSGAPLGLVTDEVLLVVVNAMSMANGSRAAATAATTHGMIFCDGSTYILVLVRSEITRIAAVLHRSVYTCYDGVIAFDGAEAGPVPAELEAVTVKV